MSVTARPRHDPWIDAVSARRAAGRLRASAPAPEPVIPEAAEPFRMPGGLGLRTYGSIPRTPTIWLIKDDRIVLPRGHVVLVAGMGGVGKGMVAVDTAARVTRGETAEGRPGTAIMVTPEDDLMETVSHRMDAARADSNRVVDMTYLQGGAQFRLDARGGTGGSVGALRAAIEAMQDHDADLRERGEQDPAAFINPVFVAIEPLLACVTAGSIVTDTGARHVLAPLQKLAAETGVCIMITHHMTKGGGDIAGSRAIVNAPRLVYTIAKDPDYDQVAILSLHKTNILGASATGGRYIIAGDGHDAHLVWGKPVQAAAEDPGELPPWRLRALAGPVAAIAGAEDSKQEEEEEEREPEEVLPALEGMRARDRLAHLREYHQGTSALSREILSVAHRLRHADTATVAHRHEGEPEIRESRVRERQAAAHVTRAFCKHPGRTAGLCRNCPRR